MSGFVYIWLDRKHKRYYVGSHWGSEDDGYVCSSSWMKQAYAKRHQDFKRRIIKRISTSRKDLLEEEQRYLLMMKPEELKGKRYYNLKVCTSHWHGDQEKMRTVPEKVSRTRNSWSEERKIAWGKAQSERIKAAMNRPEVKQKLREANSLAYEKDLTLRERVSTATKRAMDVPGVREKCVLGGKLGMKGKHHSEESKMKSSESNRRAWSDPVLLKTHSKIVKETRWKRVE